MWWVCRWLFLAAALVSTTTSLPVPDESVDTSSKLLGSSVVTSVSVIMGQEDSSSSEKSDRRKIPEALPPSTVDMLKPDGFQFYTVDEKGQLITRQMTDSEIQSIIAAGGGPFPMEPQDPQKLGDNTMGEMKAADVVENVQKVLKGELSKPAIAMGTVPTIPGHANDEWSSILPSILGGESESAPVTLTENNDKLEEDIIKENIDKMENPTTDITKFEKVEVTEIPEINIKLTESTKEESVKPTKDQTKTDDDVATKTSENEKVENTGKPENTVVEKPQEGHETPERPMIPVPVITADSVQPTTNDPSMLEEKPVYQILNTISADEVKDKDAQILVAKPVESGNVPETENVKPVQVKEPEVVGIDLPTTTETMVEMEIMSTFVPSVQKDSDKVEATSGLKETQTISTEKLDSVEKPVDQIDKSQEKHVENISEVKPTTDDNKVDKVPTNIDVASSTTPQKIETTTTAETFEQEVSEIIHSLPEQITSIVEELVSESVKDVSKEETKNNVKSEIPNSSANNSAENQMGIKVQEFKDKTNDGSVSVSEEPVVSEDKVTPGVLKAPEIPESTTAEPIFEILPEIKPDSSATETKAETPIPTKNVESKPEKTEIVSEPDKIVPENTVVVEKIEGSSETPQNLIPASVTPVNTETTQTSVEKKPETLLTELADSVSSMISQISEAIPSMVPIPQASETTEQPGKRVEDGIKPEEASTTVTSEDLLLTTVATNEGTDKPLIEDVQLQLEDDDTTTPSQEPNKPLIEDADSPINTETIKPEKTEPEMLMMEVKNPEEPTTGNSILDISETTKILEEVSTEIPASSNINGSENLETHIPDTLSESSNNVKTTENVLADKKETEKVPITPSTTAESPKISESIGNKEPVQLLQPVSITSSTAAESTKISESIDNKEPVQLLQPVSITSSTAAESTKISESIGNKDPVKPEETVSSKPEDTKPEMIETVSKEGTKTETVDSEAETPIVRIGITENKPTISAVKNNESDESSVVRIQLMNPIQIISQMIDSAPEIITPVEVQKITLPEKNILEATSPQNAASSLIAGVQPSEITEINTSEAAPPELETMSADKPQPEIENTKLPETDATQVTTEAKPVVDDKETEKLPISEPEVSKTTGEHDESKLEKPADTQNSKDTTTSIEPVLKIDASVTTSEKINAEISTKSPEKIVESVGILGEDKIKETDNSKPIIESEKTSEVDNTPKISVTPEIAVSTNVEVDQSTKESNEKLKTDIVEPVKSVEKIEETKTKIEKPETVIDTVINIPGNKSEEEKLATKVNDGKTESTENVVPVELASPAVIEETGKIETEQKAKVPVIMQTDSVIEKTESTKQKTEIDDTKEKISGEKESGDVSQTEKVSIEPVATLEIVKDEKPNSVSSENEPEKTIVVSDVKKSPISNSVQKDQPSVPLVRIDISPEKNQPESSTTKIDETTNSVDIDNKKEEKPQAIPALTENQLSEAKKPLKETDKPKDDSVAETSNTQAVETQSTLESSSKVPAKVEETKVQLPVVKEPEIVVNTTKEKIKETASVADPKPPKKTASTPVEITATPGANMGKIETEITGKPVVRLDTTLPTTLNDTPLETQEIRIQVNDTAVLVTKQKIPQKTENDDKKIQPVEIPDSTINKIQVPSEKLEKVEAPSVQSTKLPSVEKPIPNSPQPNKTISTQEVDKVTVESISEVKKPSDDSVYVKLGENKQAEKPVDETNVVKTPVSINKKPVNLGLKKETEDKWTLIPQSEPYPMIKQQIADSSSEKPSSGEKNQDVSVPLEAHNSAVSLNESTRDQDEDISLFSKLCNELAFGFWISANKGLSTARSLALSPFGMTSMLAMVFLGARGPTSGQMNDVLKLDDVVTFNPHLVFQNVSDSVNLARGQGIANAAFVRELFADRLKAGRLLPFYKERAQQFYDGHVEEVNFATISDLVRRRTNLLIRRQTGGRIRDFVKGNVMPLRSPLAALSANVFQTDCTGASSEGRDGEMYFAVLPAVRQRKLVPVPATVWRSGVLAGYEPGLDATVISLGGVGNLVSTIFVLPGQQGVAAPGDNLDHLEKRLLEGAFTNGVWDKLLRVLIPRMGLEVQVPKFSHRSVVNATAALKRMGLDDLFSKHADLKGINGIGNDLHLADMLQINLFSTCGDEVITGGRHHVEIYPASPIRGARGEKKIIEIEDNVEENPELSENENEEKRTRRNVNINDYIPENNNDEERSQRSSTNSKTESFQVSKGKQNERPLLKLDRPFLYFVRHNPTGMILHMGRFNPRLMP